MTNRILPGSPWGHRAFPVTARLWLGASLAALLLLSAGCATQGDVRALNDRLMAVERRSMELEQRNKTLQREKERILSRLGEFKKTREAEEMDIRDQSASLQATLERFREDIQRLNGKMEETAHGLSMTLDGLDNRIDRLERYIDLDSPAAGSPGIPETAPHRSPEMAEAPQTERERASGGLRFRTRESVPPPVDDSEDRSPPPRERPRSIDDQYAMAKGLFDRGDYRTARQAFQDLIQAAPRSPHADNAQFWIGETHYRERQYEEAILAYQNVIEQYPNGNKIRASLLKQGLAFYMLGDKANARRILEGLIHQYPTSSEANIARNKLNAW